MITSAGLIAELEEKLGLQRIARRFKASWGLGQQTSSELGLHIHAVEVAEKLPNHRQQG